MFLLAGIPRKLESGFKKLMGLGEPGINGGITDLLSMPGETKWPGTKLTGNVLTKPGAKLCGFTNPDGIVLAKPGENVCTFITAGEMGLANPGEKLWGLKGTPLGGALKPSAFTFA